MPVDNGKRPSLWGLWALRWGVPSAVVALVSVWVLDPTSLAGTVIAAGVALGALLVIAGSMPRRQPPVQRRARRGAGR